MLVVAMVLLGNAANAGVGDLALHMYLTLIRRFLFLRHPSTFVAVLQVAVAQVVLTVWLLILWQNFHVRVLAWYVVRLRFAVMAEPVWR
jgi:hypothetical protein